ncbi:MAG: protein SCO1/2 [Halioglobus sp.]|jgi:protein SCO1/2
MIIGFFIANAAIVCLAVALLYSQPSAPPIIQGVFLPQAQDLPDFSLLDHQNQAFNNTDLLGKWHIVSYGFTTCPDICPTTLAQLAQVQSLLGARASDIQVLFYTVDHQRDTPEQMASYVSFFHPDFVGLTHSDEDTDEFLGFEQGLGITAQLTPTGTPDANDYNVAHGINLLLINPQAQLQAILKPGLDAQRNKVFDGQTIYQDVISVINAI